MTIQMKHDTAIEAVRAAPPVVVAASHELAGVDINIIVGVATLAYIALQCAWIIYKWYRFKKDHEANKSSASCPLRDEKGCDE